MSVAVTLVAFLLLAAAVAVAFLPGLPAGIVSLAGIVLYWWGSGFTEPGPVVLAVLVAVCLLAVLADWASGVIAAAVGGASTRTALLAGGVGLALLVVTGPVGMVVGSAGTVFALEFRNHRDAGRSLTAAGAYVIGFFASGVVQALLSFAVLLSMGWIALS